MKIKGKVVDYDPRQAEFGKATIDLSPEELAGQLTATEIEDLFEILLYKRLGKKTPEKIPEQFICKHCKGDIRIRNPKGNCDHLHYPENCGVCVRLSCFDKLPPSSFQECICKIKGSGAGWLTLKVNPLCPVHGKTPPQDLREKIAREVFYVVNEFRYRDEGENYSWESEKKRCLKSADQILALLRPEQEEIDVIEYLPSCDYGNTDTLVSYLDKVAQKINEFIRDYKALCVIVGELAKDVRTINSNRR